MTISVTTDGRVRPGYRPLIASILVALAALMAVIGPASAQILRNPQIFVPRGDLVQAEPAQPQAPSPYEQQFSRTAVTSGGGFLSSRVSAGTLFAYLHRSGADITSQQWRFWRHSTEGYYVIQQVSSGHYLSASGAGTRNPVMMSPSIVSSSQTWRLVPYGGGFHTVQNVATGQYLTANHDSADALVMTEDQRPGDTRQEWRIVGP